MEIIFADATEPFSILKNLCLERFQKYSLSIFTTYHLAFVSHYYSLNLKLRFANLVDRMIDTPRAIHKRRRQFRGGEGGQIDDMGRYEGGRGHP